MMFLGQIESEQKEGQEAIQHSQPCLLECPRLNKLGLRKFAKLQSQVLNWSSVDASRSLATVLFTNLLTLNRSNG